MVGMAVFREKKLPKGAHGCFGSDSRRLITSLRPFFLWVEFRYKDPKYGHIRNPCISHFGENTSFVGPKSKFLAATKKLEYLSYTPKKFWSDWMKIRKPGEKGVVSVFFTPHGTPRKLANSK